MLEVLAFVDLDQMVHGAAAGWELYCISGFPQNELKESICPSFSCVVGFIADIHMYMC